MIASRFASGWARVLRRRQSRRAKVEYHRARLEILEPRFALAATLAPLADVTLLAGAPLNVAVHADDPNFEILYYDVSSSNPDVVPTLLDPLFNSSLRVSVSYTGRPNDASDNFSGDMVFQLFEEWAPLTTQRIIDLAETGGPDNTPFYDGLTFHRIISNFMIQGGDPSGNGTGGSGVNFDDEFVPDLQLTSSGILAMANSGSDTNDSQFFITAAPTRWLDFKHTIFGFLTSGDAIRQKIAAVPTDSNNKPLFPVQIASVSVEIDELNRVLHLAAPAGTSGTSTITVNALDMDQNGHEVVVASRSFNVTIQADTNNNKPFLEWIAPIETVAGEPVSFVIPAVDVEGDSIFYGGTADPSATDITVTVDSSTGEGTITPLSGAVGVRSVAIGVRKPTPDSNDQSPWDTQVVPVYIRPAAPSVTLAADSDTGPLNSDGVTNLNNTSAKKLRFSVTGTVNGATVQVLADGVVIGTGTATGTSMIIESTGAFTLSEGPHSLTVRQKLSNLAVNVGNLQDIVDLASDESAPTNILVDTAGPQITSTPSTNAVEGQPYSYQVTSNDAGSGARYSLVSGPTGMTIDASTGLVTWTPGGVGSSTQPATVRLMDLAGNVVDQAFAVQVQGVNAPPVATAQTVRVLSNGSKAMVLTGDDGDSEVTQILAFTIASNPAHGTITGFNPATGALTYTPNTDYFGPDSLTFTVTDDAAAGEPAGLTSAPATVSIVVTVANNAPTANAQGVTTAEDTPKSITLTGDDGNTEIVQALTFAIVQQPLHGAITGFNPATGQVTYTPAANYNGPDSFTFTVTDDDAGEPPNLVSPAATVSVNVTAVNDQPTVQSASLSTNQDTPRSIGLTAQDDGDPEVAQILTFAILSGPSHGTLSGFDPATGRVTYTPAPLYSGPDSFTFTVADDDKADPVAGLTSAAGTISIQVSAVNNPPVADVQDVAVDEDNSVAITLTGGDGDPEAQQTLTFAIVSGPSHGALTGFDPRTGTVRYTPAADYSGSDSFTFTVTDDATAGQPPSLTSSAARVSININPVDDAPRFFDAAAQSVFQTQTLRATVRAYDVDVPADTIRYSLEPGAPEGMTIDPATGDILWTVPRDFPRGTIQVSVRATEPAQGGAGLSSVRPIGVFVEDIGLMMAAVLPSNPTGGPRQDTILGRSSDSALNQSSFFPPTFDITAPLAGLLPPGGQIQPPPSLLSSFWSTDALGTLDPLASPSLGENRLGVDTGFGGGKVINPETDKQGESGADKANPQAPQNPNPGAAGTNQDSQPSKQSRRATVQPNDLALAALAAESTYYAEASEAEEPAEVAD